MRNWRADASRPPVILMGFIFRSSISILFLGACIAMSSCAAKVETPKNVEAPVAVVPPAASPTPTPSPAIPNLQRELLGDVGKTTASPIGTFDFKNYSYELPRGWENPDGSEIKLVNGRVQPVSVDVTDEMSPEEKADRKLQRRIGLSFVTVKYLDVNSDNQDEAVVVLKIETGGAAVPQVAYIYEWKGGKPELMWFFRTGDRADGGLKDIRADSGELIVELYGQDRFLLGPVETSRITGDEEQLCCPLYFTRTRYKWNGSSYLIQGKRLTFPIGDPNAVPEENLGDKVNNPGKSKK
ncbi:MAG: hypothetical protein QM785_06915 [Pyrinomonadaceae bacterium]